jgi:hypothetical protein
MPTRCNIHTVHVVPSNTLGNPAYHTDRTWYRMLYKKISVLRSWRWALVCPKHVELILEINKTVIVASSWFPYLLYLHWWCTVRHKSSSNATDVFYCKSYCLLNMFQAPLCPSSAAREYYTDGCCLWYLVLWFSSCRYGVELRVICLVCGLLKQQPANQIPQAATFCIILSSCWWWA